VLILQCFMFADGGLTALGANLFNMALVAPVVGYGVYRLVRRFAGAGLRSRLLATGFAAWCSTVAAAIACAGELAISGTVPWRVVLPAMAGVHMLVGIGEALITTLVVAAVGRARPELLREPDRADGWRRHADVAAYGVLVALGLVIFVAPFASPWPDALQSVAASLGFAPRAAVLLPSPIAGYVVPGLGAGAGSAAVAGGAGTLIAFGIAYLTARVLTPGAGARTPEVADSEAPRG
jgi:cobalt/nickel transport system permease protein